MSTISVELRKKRAVIINESRAFLDKIEKEGRDFNAEETATWDKFNADIDGLGKRIERDEALSQREAELTKILDPANVRRDNPGSAVGGFPAGDPDKLPQNEAYALSIQGWFLRNSSNLDVQEQFRPELHGRAQKQTGIGRNVGMLSIPTPGADVSGLASIQNYRRIRGAIRSGLRWDAATGMYVNTAPLTSLVGTGGGFLIPEGFSTQFETALLAYGYMRQVADVMRTTGANPLPWPTANDTTNKGRLLSQNAATSNSGSGTSTSVAYPTFGAKMFYAYKVTSDEVLVPFELIRDNAVGLVEWLGEALGIRIGRIENDLFTTGTGTAQPTGIVTECTNIAASAGLITSAKSAVLQYDDFISLEYAVDPAYRSNPGVGYMMHDTIIESVRKLKDGLGRYLWQASTNSGEPDKLNNRTLTRNQSMDSTTATGKNVALFGDLTKYKIRDVGETRLYRLVERYRDNDQDSFLAFKEVDGGLVDAGTHPVKLLQMS